MGNYFSACQVHRVKLVRRAPGEVAHKPARAFKSNHASPPKGRTIRELFEQIVSVFVVHGSPFLRLYEFTKDSNLPRRVCPIHPFDVMNPIQDTVPPRPQAGVIGYMFYNREPVPSPTDLNRLRVVLVAPRNPLNIGAVARAMSNFGFHSLRVVNPFAPSFREARSAVGASKILANAVRYGALADAVKDCTLVVGTTAVRNRDLQHPVRRPEYGARLIRQRLGASNVALLFGSEKFGLSNDALSHCHWLIRIPTRDENISMNLGQAAAVCLYELIRDAKQARSAKQSKPATAEELERITTLLLEALQTSGFLDRRRVSDADERIRRLVRRLRLPERDAVIWLGMLRQMLWKMNEGKKPEA
ncbi:MAG TPA: TrmJ/YjtD family RNA methyltransferase [Candidatus Acidoferrales bacterium]|nr:TrmJ/YjtD family RNA methyltransferase [Candidatus Acidoferrales bacterium]